MHQGRAEAVTPTFRRDRLAVPSKSICVPRESASSGDLQMSWHWPTLRLPLALKNLAGPGGPRRGVRYGEGPPWSCLFSPPTLGATTARRADPWAVVAGAKERQSDMDAEQRDLLRPSDQDEVLGEWLGPHLPTVFARWHPFVIELQRSSAAAVIVAAGIRPGGAVLDVGCGSGIPSLALAEAVGPAGRVTATDPSPVFVAAVEENARQLGLTNMEAVQACAAALPVAPNCFDAATCHMGVMFFPDIRAGLRRIREVLRPNGRAAFAAWGVESDNAFFGSFWNAARPHLPPEPPPATTAPAPVWVPGPPGPTRFAVPGSLAAALGAAGYEDVREESRTVDLVWPGAAETLRAFWLELTRIEDRMPSDRKGTFLADVLAALRRHADGDTVRFSATIVLASGRA